MIDYYSGISDCFLDAVCNDNIAIHFRFDFCQLFPVLIS